MTEALVRLPDGVQITVSSTTTVGEVLASAPGGRKKGLLGARVDGRVLDLVTPVGAGGEVRPIGEGDPEALEIVRHSTAHLLAMAVVDLFGGTKLAIGPVIENGFYYDLESPHVFTPEDFPALEKRMRHLAGRDYALRRASLPRLEAIERYRSRGENFKVEMLESWDDETVSIYHQGEFSDLCRGPHVPSTGHLRHFKLLSVAGAYWRGDEKNPMLQRIYGTAFLDADSLRAHLHGLEEAKRRDHRILGRDLDLFSFREESPGMVFWHPRGWRLYRCLVEYITGKTEARGYRYIQTPELVDKGLFATSGHLDKFGDTIFHTVSENKPMSLKPMNCPCHVEVFKRGLKSFRDLPVRLAEFGKCHRDEPAGTMHGLMRVRGFVQDDAHIFCRDDQIQDEVAAFCELLWEVYRELGFEKPEVRFADRPPQRLGDDASWDRAEAALRGACQAAGLPAALNPGEGAFYGPKLEFVLKDSLGRHWQCGTIQVDFQLPARLGAAYVDEHSRKVAPVMLHRAILGSMERFIGILLEHYAGDLPLWLQPLQARVLPISDKFLDYALEVGRRLAAGGIRCEVDRRNEKIGRKIREGEKQKIPYLLVVGEREVSEGTASLRQRKKGDAGAMPIDEIVKKFKLELEIKGG